MNAAHEKVMSQMLDNIDGDSNPMDLTIAYAGAFMTLIELMPPTLATASIDAMIERLEAMKLKLETGEQNHAGN